MLPSRSLLPPQLWVGVVLLGGCAERVVGDAVPPSPCPAGTVQRDGCQPGCDRDDVDGACDDAAHTCVDGACRPGAGVVECSAAVPTGDCPGNDVCFQGSCHSPNESGVFPCGAAHPEGYCGYGELCIGAACFPVTVDELCDADTLAGVCPADQICDAGVCRDIEYGEECNPFNPEGLCATWEECADGVCTAALPPDACGVEQPSGRCEAGFSCVAGACQPITVDTACSPERPDGLCGFREACVDGVCVGITEAPPCSAAAPQGVCPDAQACVEGACVDIPPEQGCALERPAGLCPGGQLCLAGECVPVGVAPCAPDNPTGACNSPWTCLDGACAPIPAEEACSPTRPSGLCPAGDVCFDGACVTDPNRPECSLAHLDGVCAGGALCITGDCVFPTCDAAHPAGACPADHWCQDGECRTHPCDAGHPFGECPGDALCYGGACVAQPAGQPCSAAVPDGFCMVADRVCDDRADSPTHGTCVYSCSWVRPDGYCSTGRDCLSGQCRELCPSHVLCGENSTCCGAGEECVADDVCLPTCAAPRVRCGDALLCCAAGQSCVEGACRAPCAGERCGLTGELCCAVGDVCGPELTCVPACEVDQARCGASGETCCAAGERCVFATCVAPGGPCTDFLDCDAGEYCEPSLGECLPVEATGPGASCQYPRPASLFEPVVEWRWTGHCEPSAADCQTLYENVLSMPSIADLDRDGFAEVAFRAYADDDLGQSIVVVLDGRDGSETMIYSPNVDSSLPWFFAAGHQAAVNLDDDPELELVAVAATGLAALNDPADVDDADGDGALLWIQTDYPLDRTLDGGAPTVADLDGDGQAEVVMGAVVLDGATGVILAAPGDDRALQGGGARFDGGWISTVADVDGDDLPEILTGNRAWRVRRVVDVWSMTPLWESVADVPAPPGYTTGIDIPHGFSAVANFIVTGGDDPPEVVNVGGGNLYIFDGKRGDLLVGPIPVPAGAAGNNHGGPPTVADFDGDGRPEVATAGSGCYAVYDLDCLAGGDPAARADHQALPGCAAPAIDHCGSSPDMLGVLWNSRSQDFSSAATGSSVFDFEGDGVDEVLYNDECFFRVYDGKSGTPLLVRPNSSRTNSEYPVVADVDGDRNSEIILVANHDQIGRDHCQSNHDDDPDYDGYPHYDGLTGAGEWCDLTTFPDHARECTVGAAGITVFGDTSDRWVKTRPFWPQHAYHVSDFSYDAADHTTTVPAQESPSWAAHNSYRKNAAGFAPMNAPDLRIADLRADLRDCPEISLVARVLNEGSLGAAAAGVPVHFYGLWAEPPVLLGVASTAAPLLPGASTSVSVTFEPPRGVIGPLVVTAIVDDDGSGAGGSLDECREDNNVAELDDLSCAITPPIGRCVLVSPAAAEVEPIKRVTMSGADSYDPRSPADPDGIAQWAWEVVEYPDGAWTGDFAAEGNGSADFSFWLPIAGRYVVRLTAYNRDGVPSPESPESLCVLDAVPKSYVHAQLVWDNSHNDQDLHVLWLDNPSGNRNLFDTWDCYYDNRTPAWTNNFASNPRLDIDDLSGFGPENINIDRPLPGIYRVYVSYAGNHDDEWFRPPTRNTVRLYLKGRLVGEFSRTMQSAPDLWGVADIFWHDDDHAYVLPLPGTAGNVGWLCNTTWSWAHNWWVTDCPTGP